MMYQATQSTLKCKRRLYRVMLPPESLPIRRRGRSQPGRPGSDTAYAALQLVKVPCIGPSYARK